LGLWHYLLDIGLGLYMTCMFIWSGCLVCVAELSVLVWSSQVGIGRWSALLDEWRWWRPVGNLSTRNETAWMAGAWSQTWTWFVSLCQSL